MPCMRTCCDVRPDDPDTWCSGCTEAEAEEREANMNRWLEWRQANNLDLARMSLRAHHAALMELMRS